MQNIPEPSPAETVVTLGHAIVDVLAPVGEDVVQGLGLTKGTMTLVDDGRAAQIYASLGTCEQISGGSAANTAVCLASLGRPATFIGRVRDDPLGEVFAADIAAAGVSFEVPAARSGPGTGRSMVLVTPDAEKTMCTSLGAGDLVEPDDVDASLVTAAACLYIEGYLCGAGSAEAAVARAVEAAHAGATPVALSLSDPSWVLAHRQALKELVAGADLVFANEDEARNLTGEASAGDAADHLARQCPLAVVTLGADGCLVVGRGERHHVEAVPPAAVVDTTGAGDSFAAGFLHGLLGGAGLEDAGRLGALVAAEIVSHVGARPRRPLLALASEAGLC